MTYCRNMDLSLKELPKSKRGPKAKRKAAHTAASLAREKLWNYCIRASYGARERSKKKGIPFAIDPHFLDQMLVDQKWRCAVSGAKLKPPSGDHKKHYKDQFGPSLDRIVPSVGYVPGNVRIVCNIVNVAMNEWGLENLLALVDFMAIRHKTEAKLLDQAANEIIRLRRKLDMVERALQAALAREKARAKAKASPPPRPEAEEAEIEKETSI